MAQVSKLAYLKSLLQKLPLDSSLWSEELRACAQSAACVGQLPMHFHPRQLKRQLQEPSWQSHSKHFLTFIPLRRQPHLRLYRPEHFHLPLHSLVFHHPLQIWSLEPYICLELYLCLAATGLEMSLRSLVASDYDGHFRQSMSLAALPLS